LAAGSDPSETVGILLHSLIFTQRHSGLRVYVRVVPENHCHMVLQSPDLSMTLGELKPYTARRILAYLEDQGVGKYLERFAYLRKGHKGDRSCQCWQEGSHPELIVSRRMLVQKIRNRSDPPAL
jgi:putative transposase